MASHEIEQFMDCHPFLRNGDPDEVVGKLVANLPDMETEIGELSIYADDEQDSEKAQEAVVQLLERAFLHSKGILTGEKLASKATIFLSKVKSGEIGIRMVHSDGDNGFNKISPGLGETRDGSIPLVIVPINEGMKDPTIRETAMAISGSVDVLQELTDKKRMRTTMEDFISNPKRQSFRIIYE